LESVHWSKLIWILGGFLDFETSRLQHYEFSRLFKTSRPKKQVVPWHQWHHLVRRHCWFNSVTKTQRPSRLLEDQLQPIRIMPNNLWVFLMALVLYTYSGHKSCISQDARLNFVRPFSQEFSCKTCKTKIF